MSPMSAMPAAPCCSTSTNQWDDELLAALRIPRSLLPEVLPSAADFGKTAEEVLGGEIAIGGVAGDQQSALFGQACFTAGMAKNTYGTGCFMLMHTGGKFQTSANGLLTTAAAQPTATPLFAQEGSVFVGGAVVQWLRDGLQAIEHSGQVQQLAESVPDSGGVMMVPAFTGLGAPYWKPDARGTITGLTRGTTIAHIARRWNPSPTKAPPCCLAMSRDAVARGGTPVSELRVDGGACVNNLLMQFQADLLGIPVVRPACVETTAPGRRLSGRPVHRRVSEHRRAVRPVEGRAPLCPHAEQGTRRRADAALGSRPCARPRPCKSKNHSYQRLTDNRQRPKRP